MMSNPKVFVSVLQWILIFLFSPLGAQTLQLEEFNHSQPKEISMSTRQALVGNGVRILKDNKVLCEFWFTKVLVVKPSSSAALGVSFQQIREGTFLGVGHFPSGWSDYKGRTLPKGVYVLRYAVQPADGNHMGVSFYRDFLLLTPAVLDTDPTIDYSHKKLVELSTKVSGTPHPAVLSVFPVYKKVNKPRIIKNELDQWTIAVPLQSATLGLVIIGIGEM